MEPGRAGGARDSRVFRGGRDHGKAYQCVVRDVGNDKLGCEIVSKGSESFQCSALNGRQRRKSYYCIYVSAHGLLITGMILD